MMEGRENRLKGVLDRVREEYDYIFIDCPPSSGILLTLDGLCAADTLPGAACSANITRWRA